MTRPVRVVVPVTYIYLPILGWDVLTHRSGREWWPLRIFVAGFSWINIALVAICVIGLFRLVSQRPRLNLNLREIYPHIRPMRVATILSAIGLWLTDMQPQAILFTGLVIVAGALSLVLRAG